jgi:hypothetical protein
VVLGRSVQVERGLGFGEVKGVERGKCARGEGQCSAANSRKM